MTDEPTIPGPEPTAPQGADPSSAPGPVGATPPPTGIPTTEMTAATPPGAPPPKGPSWKTWVAVAGGSIVVGAAAVFGISAATSSDSSSAEPTSQQPVPNSDGQPGQGQGPQGNFAGRGAVGTIKSIDGSTLEVSDQSGSSTEVKTTSKTKVTVTEDGSLDDVKVGDTVTVVGTQSGSSIAATSVSNEGEVSASDQRGPGGGQGFTPPQGGQNGQGFTPPQGGQNGQGFTPPDGFTPPEGFTPPQGGQGFTPPNGGSGGPGGANGGSFNRGEVESVGDGTFTMKSMDGSTVTVTTSSETEFSVTKDGSISDLKVGDTIVAMGETKDDVLTATSIREGGMGGGFFRGGGGFPGGPNGQDGQDGSSSSSSSSAGPQ